MWAEFVLVALAGLVVGVVVGFLVGAHLAWDGLQQKLDGLPLDERATAYVLLAKALGKKMGDVQ